MNKPVADAAIEAVVTAYCEAWNVDDPAVRDRILAPVWADDATYTDPTVHTIGRAPLVAHIGTVCARYPGSRIVRTSAVDLHHRVFRFTWKKVLVDGTSLPEGIDFGELTAAGTIQRIIGFFGPVSRID
jgi:hypothetical protein